MSGFKPKIRITKLEKEWVDLMIDANLGPIEAARKTFKWRCEPGSSESRKAVNLKKTERIKEYTLTREEKVTRETEAHKLFLDKDVIEWDKLRKFAFERLEFIRDDPNAKAQHRFNAIQAIKKLSDPSKDSGLILMWLNLIWRGANAHCPQCHKTFPLNKIKNKDLESYWEKSEQDIPLPILDTFDRRMEIIVRSDPRKRPHPGQVIALSAEERHVAGKGPARAGKSLLLAWMALLFFLIPGVEIWILARIYEDARSEIEYLKRFLNTLFYPYYNKLVKETFDAKTSELTLISKWGSELRVRSAKAKGSITGRELEAALVAEPGWVPEDLYEELRARMSSRLGRIIMFGTPKGYGGILGRMLSARGRDPRTHKIVRIPPEKRTLAAGMPWGSSLMSYTLTPQQNPEYVKSELESARLELLDSEYASEFEGEMTMEEGAKFPQVKERHLVNVPFDTYSNCVFILGIDQGPKNFAGCLIAYDGKKIYVAGEYFETDDMTMKHHMNVLRQKVPIWIRRAGGPDDSWKLTIFDADPPLLNELNEFDLEGRPWPTDVTFRPKNIRGQYNQSNWRLETYEYLNILASPEDCDIMWDLQNTQLLHDQVMQVQNKPTNVERDDITAGAKHWIVNDPWRGDHVLDALMLALWTVLSNQIEMEYSPDGPHKDPYREHKASFDYQRRVEEARELTGYTETVPEDQIWEQEFGRKKDTSKRAFPSGGLSVYKDY